MYRHLVFGQLLRTFIAGADAGTAAQRYREPRRDTVISFESFRHAADFVIAC